GAFPGPSYLTQLTLKQGNDAELGKASLVDIVVRVQRRVAERAGMLTAILTRRWVAPEWWSPAVILPILLITLGLIASTKADQGLLVAYFVSHEVMYALWPWPIEMRFLLPVAPLAYLYLWRGALLFRRVTCAHPRAVAVAALCLAMSVSLTCAAYR